MRKASKYILMCASALLMLAGCAGKDMEPEVDNRKDCPDFSATIAGAETRAFDRQWEAGDEIGITGAGRINVSYLTSAGNGSFKVKKQGDQIYFQNDAEATFTAYYPWKDMPAGRSSIDADTRTQSQKKNFDFLWATASGKKDSPDVTFDFSHRMTKVALTVKAGNGMDYEDIKKAALSLEGFMHTGSFNVNDGTTAVGRVGGAWTFTDFVKSDDTQKTLTCSLILFPQTFAGPLEFLAQFEATGNHTHSLKADIDFTGANREIDGDAAKNEWVAGRQYNLSLTLHKTEITVGECQISSWNIVNGADITVD